MKPMLNLNYNNEKPIMEVFPVVDSEWTINEELVFAANGENKMICCMPDWARP